MSDELSLTHSYVRKDVAAQIVADIDAYACATYDEGPRTHLGASLIGADCTRATWYEWRWMGNVRFNGRMLRLFNRGHREEDHFVEYIKGIGGEVYTADPNLPLKNGKPQQYKVSRVGGHFGGSLDGIVRLPLRYNCGSHWMLAEFKTKGTGRGFENLKAKGIMLTNGQHYDQMSTYGWNYNLELSLYFTVNKNDDDLHCEIVPLNFKRAAEVEHKATYIIQSQTPPPRIAQSPTFTKCVNCHHRGVCHFGEVPAKNCRSCQYATPVDGAQWYCNGHQTILSPETIKTGCPQWDFIKSAQ